MEKSPSSAKVETDINSFLVNEDSLAEAVNELLKVYATAKLNKSEISAICVFLIKAGFPFTLCKFLVERLSRDLNVSWPHFIEALFKSNPAIPEAVKAAVIKGAVAQNQMDDLARSTTLDHFDDRMAVLRQKRSQMLKESLAKRRAEMIETLKLYRAQGLLEIESELLNKLEAAFPNDAEVLQLKKNQQAKISQDLVQNIEVGRPSWIPLAAYQKPDSETLSILANIETSMQEELQQNPNEILAYDFTIAHVMWENYEAALRITESALNGNSQMRPSWIWLKLEILFQLRRHVDVLNLIGGLEVEWSNDPQATFALLYIQASCLWELSQKQQAIEIMESVCIARPNFRSARILLAEWRGEIS